MRCIEVFWAGFFLDLYSTPLILIKNCGFELPVYAWHGGEVMGIDLKSKLAFSWALAALSVLWVIPVQLIHTKNVLGKCFANLKGAIFHLLCSTFGRQAERSDIGGRHAKPNQGRPRLTVLKPDAACFSAVVTAERWAALGLTAA